MHDETVVKVIWEDKRMYRLRLAGLTFALFIEMLAKRFAPHVDFSVRYTDDDGDLVTVTTTEDLEEAVRVTSKPKFVVAPRS